MHYDLVTLIGNPVVTDPGTIVPSPGSQKTNIRMNVSFKAFLGLGSGESNSTEFAGNGFVVIQVHEEVTFKASCSGGPGMQRFTVAPDRFHDGKGVPMLHVASPLRVVARRDLMWR